MTTRPAYPSDLTDEQFRRIERLFGPAKWATARGGRPATYTRKDVVDAILYSLRTGCAWRALPHDFPPWNSVFKYFAAWTADGTWQRIHDELRWQVRRSEGREGAPSAAILDSQSVKTTERGARRATTPAKRRKAASGTSSSIHSA